MPCYEAIRKIRVLSSGNGKYCEYIVNLPKNWVNAITQEQGVDPKDMHLKIWYNEEFRAKILKGLDKTKWMGV